MIEKHFTDDKTEKPIQILNGSDRWKKSCKNERARDTLGDGLKVEENEKETYVLQRRALRAAVRIEEGSQFTKDNIIPLRPCPSDGMLPNQISQVQVEFANTVLKKVLINPDNLI